MSKVLVHADGGDCHGTPLTNENVCPKCGIHPDTQSTEFWEIESSPIKQDYIDAFKLMEVLRTSVRNKIASITDFDRLTITGVNESDVRVETTWQDYGSCETEYESFVLTWEELAMSDEDYTAHYKAREELRQQEKDRLAKEEKERKEREDAVVKEKEERDVYERLRKKFGDA